jgi:hypothetical protein
MTTDAARCPCDNPHTAPRRPVDGWTSPDGVATSAARCSLATNHLLFLHSEPPDQEAQLEDTWVDRERELDFALTKARQGVDEDTPRPMAIVGLARVGKSHLLRRIARALEQEGRVGLCTQVRVGARKQELSQVLLDVYDQCRRSLGNLWQLWRQEGQRGPLAERPFAHLDLLMQHLRPLFTGQATDVHIEDNDAVIQAIKANAQGRVQGGGKGKLGGDLTDVLGLGSVEASASGEVGAGLEGSRTDQQGSRRTIRYKPFGDLAYAYLIVELFAPLWDVDPTFRWLLVVDDFDLLKRDTADRLDPQPLLHALCHLAEQPGIHVLTTVRQDTYAAHDKELLRLVQLRPLTPPNLVQIYEKHCMAWNDADQPLRLDFVKEAAARSEGRVGLFLSFLKDVFEFHGEQHPDLSDYLAGLYDEYKAAAPALLDALTKVEDPAGADLPDNMQAALRNSILASQLFEDYSTHNKLRVHPIFADHLRGRA